LPRYAHIIVDIVHENVAHDFTYRVPAGMRIQPGQRVEVPFGRLRKEGIVLSLSDETEVPPDKLRDVLQTLVDYPAVLPQMIALAQWMAQESHCPLAETLRLMIPSEMRGGRVHEKTRPMVQLAIPQDQLPDAIDRQGRSKKRRLILQLISDGKPHAVGDLKLMVSDPLPDIKKLA